MHAHTHTWGPHSSHKLAVLNAPERVLSVIPAAMVHVLPQQLDGRLGTIVLQLSRKGHTLHHREGVCGQGHLALVHR